MKRIIYISLSFILLMTSCAEDKQPVSEKKSNPYVKTATTEFQKYQPVKQFSGTLFAKREANLSSVLPGRVEKFYVDAGEAVKKDQLIATLSGELLTQAQIEYETYKKDFGRVSRLQEKGSIPEQKYDHVKAQYEAKKANYELIRKNTQIRAPFAGTITEKMIEEGESFIIMNPGLKPGYSHASGVVRLMDLSTIEAEIEINEKAIRHFAKGMQAMIKVDAYPNREWTGKITKIAHTFDTMTKSATVTIEIDNRDKILKPGMYCHVNIAISEREDIFVPLRAIYRQPGTGNDFVFVINNNKAEKRAIQRLYTKEDVVAVSGIDENETIVVEGKAKLQTGTTVNIAGK